MIILTIKGNIYEARAALDAHGLGTIMAMDPRAGWVRAEVDDRDEGIVQRWFLEPGEPPFPPGALLHYVLKPDGWYSRKER